MSPRVSIIIRTLNEGKHLGNLLAGIEAQTFTDWEIINVDSGSTDRTLEIIGPYAARVIRIASHEFTYGRALNLGGEAAAGEYLVIVSAHVYPVNNTWLQQLISPFQEPSIGMVYGRQRGVSASRVGEERDLLRSFGPTSKILIDEPLSNNGNSAIRRELWRSQPFDPSLPGLEDLDWARKVQRKGFRVYYAADAAVYHIHEESLKKIYRRYRGEAIAYKRIFPAVKFTRADLVKAALFDSGRDLLYSLRTGKSPRKLLGIPAARLAHYLGVYHGMDLRRTTPPALPAPPQHAPSAARRVIVSGPGQHYLEGGDPPAIQPHEALVQVAYAGVSPVDIDVLEGRLECYREGRALYPITPGHEYCGVAAAVGKAVRGLKKGDKVVGECLIGCGRCHNCLKREEHLCSDNLQLGVVNADGAYASYLRVPARYLHRVAADVPLKYAALAEPLAVCLRGLDRLRPDPGKAACVLGAGPLGNLCAQVLRRRGVRVTVIDPNEQMLRLLRRFDADTLPRFNRVNLFDYIIETSGDEAALPSLIESSKPSARILILSAHGQNASDLAFGASAQPNGGYGPSASAGASWEQAVRLIRAGAVDLQEHTDTVVPLEEYERAWELHRSQNYLKVLLSVNRELAER